MKNNYKITYRKGNNYHANIAVASSKSDCEAYYNKKGCEWFDVAKATTYDVQDANRKHMPIIDIPEQEATTEKEATELPSQQEQKTEMFEHCFTVGLFDREAERQLISTEDARNFISELLISKYDIYAFTMIDCFGVYRMQSTKAIVKEPSFRIEIAADAQLSRETALSIIKDLKEGLNQESVMYKATKVDIEFI